MTEDAPTTRAGKREVGFAGPALAGLALAAGAAGTLLVREGERQAVAGGVLLLIAALALAGVAVGGVRYDPEVEGGWDLSTRLGLGALGGLLGAAVAITGDGALSTLGIPGLLSVDLAAIGGGHGMALRLLHGSLWGILLGVLFPWIPGRSAPGRGAAFSLVPSLHVLLVVFPGDPGAGPFGVRLGALAFVFVLLLNALWGIVAGWTLGGAEAIARDGRPGAADPPGVARRRTE